MTPRERIALKEAQAKKDAESKGLKNKNRDGWQDAAKLAEQVQQAKKGRPVNQDKVKNAKSWRDINDGRRVNDWRDVTDYRVHESDRNDEGIDSTLIRIMIPKRQGVDVMKDVERIENEIGALSHNITMVIGEISGETGSHWAVDFTVEWDFAHSTGRSDKFLELLLRNIENNIEGIGSIKLV